MGCLSSGILRIPIVVAASVGVTSLATDLADKVSVSKLSRLLSIPQQPCSSFCDSVPELTSSGFSHLRIGVPLSFSIPNSNPNFFLNFEYSSFATSSILMNLYQSTTKLAPNPKSATFTYTAPSPHSDVCYRWHLPDSNADNDNLKSTGCCLKESRTVVVLLGWLGAKQKHLRKYAEWYTSRGFHAITFTFPMAEILSYQVGGKTEKSVELLVTHLAEWLKEDEQNLVFHTFSNTGWLTYGVILEKFQKQDPSWMGRIRGCVIDSAPAATPDPQVWASGFSAAFLKKQSIFAKSLLSRDDTDTAVLFEKQSPTEPKSAVAEAALQLFFEKFFKVVLRLPTVNRRLCDVVGVLSGGQPTCPQLYIYSSADEVIPVGSVESFIEGQRKAGHEVRACNFISTPHVDHFRNHPKLYTSQLSQFLEDCVLTISKDS